MRNHLFESAYFDGTHSCSNSWRRSCECGPLNSLTPFWCREAKVWPTWLTFGEASLWCQHSSHPPSPPPWCDAGSRGQWSSSRCPPSPGPGASLPLWHHAPEPWQNTKINNNKHYIWYIQCYYTQSVSHYMDAICTKFATSAPIQDLSCTQLNLTWLQPIKTLDNASQRVEHRRSLCKSQVSRRKRLYQWFCYLITLQQWSAKQSNHVTSCNQHSSLRKFGFHFQKMLRFMAFDVTLWKFLVTPWEKGNKFPC